MNLHLPIQKSERSCICVVDFSSVSMIFPLDFETILLVSDGISLDANVSSPPTIKKKQSILVLSRMLYNYHVSMLA